MCQMMNYKCNCWCVCCFKDEHVCSEEICLEREKVSERVIEGMLDDVLNATYTLFIHHYR